MASIRSIPVLTSIPCQCKPSGIKFSQRSSNIISSRRQINLISLSRVPTRVILAAKKHPWRGARKQRKKLQKFENFLGFGFSALMAASFAGLLATLAATAITTPILMIAGAAGIITLLTAIASVIAVLSPLIPLLAVGAAMGLPSAVIKFSLWLFLDKIMSFVLIINFLGSVLATYWRTSSKSEVSRRTKEIMESAQLASAISYMPLIGGSAWIVGLNHWAEYLGVGQKTSFVKNAFLYSLPVMVIIAEILFSPRSQPLLVSPFGSGLNAWWLAMILGGIHFQLERRRVTNVVNDEYEDDDEQDEVDSEELEYNRQRAAMEEFDILLGRKAGSDLSEFAEEWTVGDVATWLQKKNMSRYVSSFLDHDVDGRVLLSLTDSEIKDDIGIKSLGDRKRIRESIEKLK